MGAIIFSWLNPSGLTLPETQHSAMFYDENDGILKQKDPAGIISAVGSDASTLPTQTGHGGQYLLTDGSNVRWASATTHLSGLTDVVLTSVTDNQVLQYDAGLGKWENTDLPALGLLEGLTDCTITDPAGDDVLTYNSNGYWENVAPVPVSQTLYATTTPTSATTTFNDDGFTGLAGNRFILDAGAGYKAWYLKYKGTGLIGDTAHTGITNGSCLSFDGVIACKNVGGTLNYLDGYATGSCYTVSYQDADFDPDHRTACSVNLVGGTLNLAVTGPNAATTYWSLQLEWNATTFWEGV